MKRIWAAAALLSMFVLSVPCVAPAAAAKKAEQRIYVSVTARGFEPATIPVKAGKPFVLVVTRKTQRTCATELVIPNRKVNVPLPLNKPVEIRLAAERAGSLRFGCAMDMIAGVIVVE